MRTTILIIAVVALLDVIPQITASACTVSSPICGTIAVPDQTDFVIEMSDPVDPVTVQASDLMVDGIAANTFFIADGNTTITFHFKTSPVVVGVNTMHIPAGAFDCGPAADFTCTFSSFGIHPTPRLPTPRPRPTPAARPTPPFFPPRVNCPQYAITPGADTIVPGDTDTGNHCVWCDTLITLPFPFVLYDQTFTAVNVTSSGRLDFVCPNEPASAEETCLPALPNNCPYDYTIFPLWAEWSTFTDQAGCSTWANGCGIFTSISGTAPNRIFNIEWHVTYRFNSPQTANFEVRLYENDPTGRFDVIYGETTAVNPPLVLDSSGVQGLPGFFTRDFCSVAPPQNTSRTYQLEPCGTPTPTTTPRVTPAPRPSP